MAEQAGEGPREPGQLSPEQGVGMVQIRQQGAGQGHGDQVPEAGIGQGRGELGLVGKQDAGDGKQQVALGGHGLIRLDRKRG